MTKSIKKAGVGRIVFCIINYTVLALLGLLCILPIIHLLAVSLSDKVYADLNMVGLWPKGFTFDAYRMLFKGNSFFHAAWISIQRSFLGTILNVILIVMFAYPMSKESRDFRGRTIYMVFFVITMVFSGGMVPFYELLKNMNLFDTIWVLVIPGAMNVYNGILMMNYMRGLPKELEESSFIDGANQITTLVKILLPLCLPVLATVTLFSFVGHWNSWFDGLIYNNNVHNYPLQTYLQVLLTEKVPQGIDSAIISSNAATRSLKDAQIFVTMLPLLVIYPFLQKYFVKGIVVGAVKG